MRGKCLIFFPAVLLLFISCGGNERLGNRLSEIDRLIDFYPDSALLLLRQTNVQNSDEKNTAMYNMLLTQAMYICYQPLTSDSLINFSIDYYKRHNQTSLLARSLYYKGATIYDFGRKEEAMRCLKEAEQKAVSLQDKVLINKIYERICMVNFEAGYKSEYLKYAKKLVDAAFSFNDTANIAQSLNVLASAYEANDYADSGTFYLEKALAFVPENKKELKAVITANLGNAHLARGETDQANVLLDKALNIYPLSYAYILKGEILYKECDKDSAYILWNKAIKNGDLSDRIYTYGLIRKYYNDKSMSDKVLQIDDSINNLRDIMEKENKEIAVVQAIYDEKEKKRQEQCVIYIETGAVIFLLFMLLVVLLWYYKSSVVRYKDIIISKISQEKELERRLQKQDIKEMELETSIRRAKRRMDDIVRKRDRLIQQGHDMLVGIENGTIKSVLNMSDKELEKIIFYYNKTNRNICDTWLMVYDKIKPRQIIFLIFRDMGYSTARISEIMGIESSSVRSLKSRLEKKAKTKNVAK